MPILPFPPTLCINCEKLECYGRGATIQSFEYQTKLYRQSWNGAFFISILWSLYFHSVCLLIRLFPCFYWSVYLAPSMCLVACLSVCMPIYLSTSRPNCTASNNKIPSTILKNNMMFPIFIKTMKSSCLRLMQVSPSASSVVTLKEHQQIQTFATVSQVSG